MNKKKNYSKGARLEILKLLHICGLIPLHSFEMLHNNNTRVYQQRAKEMEREGVTVNYRIPNSNYKYVHMQDYEKNMAKYDYRKYLPEGYYERYVTYGAIDSKRGRSQTDKTKQERAIRNAEIFIMMYGAKINSLPEDKIMLGSEEYLREDQSYYYTSREIKNYTGYKSDVEITYDNQGKESSKKVKSSRVLGLYTSPGGDYAVYQLGRNLVNWNQSGEYKISILINKILCAKYKEPRGTDSRGIIISQNAETLRKAIGAEDAKAEAWFRNIEDCYKELYVLPYNQYGQQMLKIMGLRGWKEKSREMFLNEQQRQPCSIPCDGYDGERYYLLYCIPDVKKLRLFLRRAALEDNPRKYVVICFKEQAQMVAAAGRRHITIMTAEFKEYENEIKLA